MGEHYHVRHEPKHFDRGRGHRDSRNWLVYIHRYQAFAVGYQYIPNDHSSEAEISRAPPASRMQLEKERMP